MEPRGHSVRAPTKVPTSRSPRETDTPAADVSVERSMVYSMSESDDATDSTEILVAVNEVNTPCGANPFGDISE